MTKNTANLHIAESSSNEIELVDRYFETMQQAVTAARTVSHQTRQENLRTLYDIIDQNSTEICDALNDDFGCRSEVESTITDIVGSLSSIRYLKNNLKSLMRARRRRTSIWYMPASNKVKPQPLGVVGVMSPWNYPVHLMIAPAAAALAAGNRVLAKMSEDTPAVSALMQKLITENFSEDTFRIINGGSDVAAHFSSKPFDHLLFTGSTQVGRKIALAAAKNLTPVTLELSGKSPALITLDYHDVEEAARRIFWGKAFNAGQTCVAPDYALVPKTKLIEFVRGCRYAANDFFPEGMDDENYTSVINQRQRARLEDLLEDAKKKGAELIQLTESNDAQDLGNKLPVTLVLNPSPDTRLYTEEVFGPILPVFTFEETDQAIKQINASDDPLAMYVFANYGAQAQGLIGQTRAAGVAINDTLLQYLQNDLPFGGRGYSGSGQYHGREGFETFSHMQAVFQQRGFGRFTSVKLLYPPYGKLTSLVGAMIRKLP